MPTSPEFDVPSLAFAKDRVVLTIREIASRWRVSDRHVIDLIEEGKLVAFDIAGRQDFVRVPMAAIDILAHRLGIGRADVLKIIQASVPKINQSRRAFYRVPVVEGFNAFMRENNSLSISPK